MKISSTPPPPPLRTPAVSPRSDHETFGFDELGVFGLDQDRPASPAPDESRIAGREEPPAISNQASGNPWPSFTVTNPDAARPTPYEPHSPRPAPARCDVDPAGVWHQYSTVEPSEAGVCGEPLRTTSPDLQSAVSTEEGSAMLRPMQEAPAASHSLLVSMADGRASIAVRAQQLDGEGRALLRRLVREILAGHRLSLADFHLNGVPLGADFLDMTGGSNGPRTR